MALPDRQTLRRQLQLPGTRADWVVASPSPELLREFHEVPRVADVIVSFNAAPEPTAHATRPESVLVKRRIDLTWLNGRDYVLSVRDVSGRIWQHKSQRMFGRSNESRRSSRMRAVTADVFDLHQYASPAQT